MIVIRVGNGIGLVRAVLLLLAISSSAPEVVRADDSPDCNYNEALRDEILLVENIASSLLTYHPPFRVMVQLQNHNDANSLFERIPIVHGITHSRKHKVEICDEKLIYLYNEASSFASGYAKEFGIEKAVSIEQIERYKNLYLHGYWNWRSDEEKTKIKKMTTIERQTYSMELTKSLIAIASTPLEPELTASILNKGASIDNFDVSLRRYILIEIIKALRRGRIFISEEIYSHLKKQYKKVPKAKRTGRTGDETKTDDAYDKENWDRFVNSLTPDLWGDIPEYEVIMTDLPNSSCMKKLKCGIFEIPK